MQKFVQICIFQPRSCPKSVIQDILTSSVVIQELMWAETFPAFCPGTPMLFLRIYVKRDISSRKSGCKPSHLLLWLVLPDKMMPYFQPEYIWFLVAAISYYFSSARWKSLLTLSSTYYKCTFLLYNIICTFSSVFLLLCERLLSR